MIVLGAFDRLPFESCDRMPLRMSCNRSLLPSLALAAVVAACGGAATGTAVDTSHAVDTSRAAPPAPAPAATVIITKLAGDSQTAVVGSAVAVQPSIRLTTLDGKPLAN